MSRHPSSRQSSFNRLETLGRTDTAILPTKHLARDTCTLHLFTVVLGVVTRVPNVETGGTV